jgi:hypothetical protein
MVNKRLKEDFEFIIRGKYLKGHVPKQAYFQENRQELDANNRPAYFPNGPIGMYDIEDDEYYAVVVVVPVESITTDKNFPIPRLSKNISSPIENYRLLLEGDVKIFQIPYRFPTKTHEATDPRKPVRRQYMVGNTILAALDGRINGYDETCERIRVPNRQWKIYGHDVYENAAITHPPHNHCLNLLNQTGDPNRTNFWTVDDHFSDRFKT